MPLPPSLLITILTARPTSAADIAITKRLVEALKLLDVRVLDHLIVGEGRGDNIVSLAERGLI